jgi:glutaredoxin
MRLITATVLFVLLLPASAQHYRWTDERGRIHFSDAIPPASARNVQVRDAPPTPEETAADPYVVQQARQNFPLTLYSAPGCEGCEKARALLNARGAPFREVSVTTQEQYETLKGVANAATVPVLLVGNQVHKGFDEGTYDLALDTAGYPRKGVLPPRKQAAPDPSKAQSQPQSEPAPRGPYAPRTGPASPVLTPEPERRVLR